MRDSGKKTSNTVRVKKLGLTVLCTMETTSTVKSTARVYLNGQMELCTRATSLITIFTGSDNISGLTAESTQATGGTTRCTEEASSGGLTAESTRATTLKIKRRAKVYLNGKYDLRSFNQATRRPDGRKYIGNWMNGK